MNTTTNTTTSDFTARRLQVARALCKQAGIAWCGLEISERDALLDIAGNALAATAIALAPEAVAAHLDKSPLTSRKPRPLIRD